MGTRNLRRLPFPPFFVYTPLRSSPADSEWERRRSKNLTRPAGRLRGSRPSRRRWSLGRAAGSLKKSEGVLWATVLISSRIFRIGETPRSRPESGGASRGGGGATEASRIAAWGPAGSGRSRFLRRRHRDIRVTRRIVAVGAMLPFAFGARGAYVRSCRPGPRTRGSSWLVWLGQISQGVDESVGPVRPDP